MPRREGRSEHGATALVIVAMLFGFGAVIALALNIGHFVQIRAELQAAVDAGALAGARDLDGTVEGIAAARYSAETYTERHGTDATGTPIDIDPGRDITFGEWIEDTQTFDPTQMDPMRINAVRVAAARGAVDVWFSALLQHTTFGVIADAVACGGAPCDEKCPVPFALPACMLYVNGVMDCSADRVYRNDVDDNICFTNLVVVGEPVPDQIPDNCINNPSNSCVRSILKNDVCTTVDRGDQISLQNGADENAQVVEAARLYITQHGGDPEQGIEVMAPIVKEVPGDEPCKCNQLGVVDGFAKFTFAVKDDDGDGKLDMIAFGHHCWEVTSSATRSGCTYFGTAAVAADPRLVK